MPVLKIVAYLKVEKLPTTEELVDLMDQLIEVLDNVEGGELVCMSVGPDEEETEV